MPKKLLLQDLDDAPPRLPDHLKPKPAREEDPAEVEKMKQLLDSLRSMGTGKRAPSESSPNPSTNGSPSARSNDANGYAH